MADSTRIQIARDCYRAFATGDRLLVERVLDDPLEFSSPVDVALDRAGYFRRCWPGAGRLGTFAFERMIEVGDEVIATYEAVRSDGSSFRNTEVLTFRGERISRIEVYFGWELGRAESS